MPNGRDRSTLALPHLKAWRVRKLMTQDQLAAASGVAKSTIVRIEGGYPATLSTIRKLAQALSIDGEDLIYREPPAISGDTGPKPQSAA